MPTRVRALYEAVSVRGAEEPYATAHLLVHYPAAGAADPVLGVLPPDRDRGPLPVVVLAGNYNCGPELYGWLARRLTRQGCAVVSFAWVARMFDGRPGLSTGIDFAAVTPQTFGSRVPSALLPAILDRLRAMNDDGDLAGALDLDRVVLGGHSAGGTLALLCASWLPGVRGAFSYGGHTRTQVPQGFGPDHYLPLGDGPPVLLMGGAEDGVVEAIAQAQLGAVPPGHPMQRTAAESLPPERIWRTVILEGANHYSMTDGYDGVTGRGYLEPPATGDPVLVRDRIASLVEEFVAAVCSGHLPATKTAQPGAGGPGSS